MSAAWVKQKIIFVEAPKNSIDKKKSIIKPGIAIINKYSLIAVFYLTSFASLFYCDVENIFPALIWLPALLSLINNDLILIPNKKKIPENFYHPENGHTGYSFFIRNLYMVKHSCLCNISHHVPIING